MGGKRILVVDEAAESRDVLVSILAMRDYRAVAAKSIEEAMQMAGKQATDLVVIDLKHYQKDRWDQCRQLRGCPGLEDVPVVALAPDRPRIQDAQPCPPSWCQFLIKPFDYSELLAMIARQLDDGDPHPGP